MTPTRSRYIKDKGTIRLTYQMRELRDSMDRPALETELDVTPAMIAAGIDVISDAITELFDGFLTPRQVASDLFRAMMKARHKT